MKRSGMIALLLALPLAAHAGPGADAGLEKLKSNADTAKANLDDYKKNLATVEKNIGEASKARLAAEEQKKAVASALHENKAAMAKMDKHEAEITALMKEEQMKMAAEDKKVAELEALMAQIKGNHVKREANIANYQQQLETAKGERQSWKERDKSLLEQQAQAAQKAKAMTATEVEWRNKKKGYEGEVGRWQRESDKQAKILSQFQNLADSK